MVLQFGLESLDKLGLLAFIRHIDKDDIIFREQFPSSFRRFRIEVRVRRIHLEHTGVRENVVILGGKRNHIFDVVLFGKISHQLNLVVLYGTDNQVNIRKRLARQYLTDALRPITRVIDRQVQRKTLTAQTIYRQKHSLVILDKA